MSATSFTDEEFFDSENDLLAIFGLEAADAPRTEDTQLTAAHGERIDNIVSEGLREAVVRDTTTFFFKTFGVGLSGVADTLFRSLSELSRDVESESAELEAADEADELKDASSEIDLDGPDLEYS